MLRQQRPDAVDRVPRAPVDVGPGDAGYPPSREHHAEELTRRAVTQRRGGPSSVERRPPPAALRRDGPADDEDPTMHGRQEPRGDAPVDDPRRHSCVARRVTTPSRDRASRWITCSRASATSASSARRETGAPRAAGRRTSGTHLWWLAGHAHRVADASSSGTPRRAAWPSAGRIPPNVDHSRGRERSGEHQGPVLGSVSPGAKFVTTS